MMTHILKPVLQVEKVLGQKNQDIEKVEKPQKPPGHSILCWFLKHELIVMGFVDQET